VQRCNLGQLFRNSRRSAGAAWCCPSCSLLLMTCVQMLSQLLDGMLERYQAMKYTMGPRHLIRESQRIHSVCMFEVVRQVSVHCIERGVLLKRVWE
jgi:hypothetical protein